MVTGTLAFDSIKTPFGQKRRILGGSAAHFSLSSSYFCRTGIVGIVGGDFPKKFHDYLKKWPIDLRGVVVDRREKTFAWGGVYGKKGEDPKSLFTDLNCLLKFDPRLPGLYKYPPYVFLANIDPEIQWRFLKGLPARTVVGADTMNFWINTKKKSLMKLISRVNYFFLNESELLLLTGASTIDKGFASLRSRLAGWVVCKRGKKGCVLYSKKDRIDLPAYVVRNVLDPTGAGDSFAGAFMGYLAQAANKKQLNPVEEAAVSGNIAGSFAVQGFGASWRKRMTRAAYRKRREVYLDSLRN